MRTPRPVHASVSGASSTLDSHTGDALLYPVLDANPVTRGIENLFLGAAAVKDPLERALLQWLGEVSQPIPSVKRSVSYKAVWLLTRSGSCTYCEDCSVSLGQLCSPLRSMPHVVDLRGLSV